MDADVWLGFEARDMKRVPVLGKRCTNCSGITVSERPMRPEMIVVPDVEPERRYVARL